MRRITNVYFKTKIYVQFYRFHKTNNFKKFQFQLFFKCVRKNSVNKNLNN